MLRYHQFLFLTFNFIRCDLTKEPGNLTDLDICKVSHLGLEYTGHVGKTESGVRCQSWTAKKPIHKIDPSFKNENFSDFSMKKAKNYCRNPNRNPNGPWCYTMDSQLIDETCAIPLCSFSECRITGPGMEFGGVHNYGVTGKLMVLNFELLIQVTCAFYR